MSRPVLGAMRSHAAGALGPADVGTPVRLAGWVAHRRDHGGVVFVDLRDAAGVAQVVFHPNAAPEATESAHELRGEDCVRVTGTVRARPPGSENPRLASGGIEVLADALELLAPADTPPFPVDGAEPVDEALRLQYRYLDLRRPWMADRLRLRATVNSVTRRVMEEHGFLEVETPSLTRATPEGARDFLVPTHLQPGALYALPQSPQLFKQLLMVSGVERYYQIVRCFRDEALRADRQPEFTQLDVELSFLDEEDVYRLVERLMAELFRTVLGVELPLPLPRMRYADAMTRFGTDKPDLRYAMELVDLSGVLAGTGFRGFGDPLAAGGRAVGIRVAGGADLSRARLDALAGWARSRGAGGLAWFVVEPEALRSPVARHLTGSERAGLVADTEAVTGDLVLVAAGPTAPTRQLVGELRTRLAAERGLAPAGRWAFTWITEPPMFEWDEQAGRWDAVHHPFTAPSPEWEPRFDAAPGAATARAYDLVLNGVELGGGSLRIHRAAVQRRVFDVLGIAPDEAEEKFGFLLRALRFGPPPHGGIAFGMDRIAMLLAGVDSIREVIAFPKTQSGADPLTGAPAVVPTGQLAELGLRPVPDKP